MKATFNTLNTIAISLCGGVMILLGSWLPPLVEAPPSPRIKLEQAFEV